jgi:hypothetical protein
VTIVERFLPPTPMRAVSRLIVLGVSHALGFLAPLELIPGDALHDASSCEVLVVHGREDGTVPFALSEQLAAEHPNVTLRATDGAHDSLARTTLEDAALREEVISALGVGR